MKIGYNLLWMVLVCSMLPTSVFAATVDGIPIHFTVTGNGYKTVLLVHGWTCDATSWQSQVPELSKRYQVVTMDLPGHGPTPLPKSGRLSMDLFARAVEAVRSDVRANRMILIGHSMGTAVILQYACLYPQHVAALVFVEGLTTSPWNQKAPTYTVRQFSSPAGLRIREGMIRDMFSSATTDVMRQNILSRMLGTSPIAAVEAMNAVRNPGIWKQAIIKMPVLGIYADNPLMSVNPDEMKQRFPNLTYARIPGTGHFLMMEKPSEFNHLLESFLEKQNY